MKHYILLFFVVFGSIFYVSSEYKKSIEFQKQYEQTKIELLSQKVIIPSQNIISVEEEKIDNQSEQISNTKISTNLDVDFYPQSPFGKWGPIFEDTCEEASVLLAINYVRGVYMTRTEFRDELLNIVDWQNKNFGYYKDTNVEETSQIIRDYYDFDNYEIIENPSIQDIKNEISKENIVIAPLFASNLNPNYTGSGPDYHFLVIKGYTQNSFITHDVGTRNGENYYYNQNTLFSRIHDFHPTDIQLGEKKIIVLRK